MYYIYCINHPVIQLEHTYSFSVMDRINFIFNSFIDSSITYENEIRTHYSEILEIVERNEIFDNQYLDKFQICFDRDFSRYYFIFSTKEDEYFLISSFELYNLESFFVVAYE